MLLLALDKTPIYCHAYLSSETTVHGETCWHRIDFPESFPEGQCSLVSCRTAGLQLRLC